MRRRSSVEATSGCRRSRSVSFVAADERHVDAERLLCATDRLVVQEGDDGLPERHRLDREDPVPAGVQLVDHDVGGAVPLEGLVVVETFDELEIGVEPLDRRDHVLGALAPPGGGSVHDQRPRAVRGRLGLDPAQVDPRRDHLRLGHPADGVVGADDLGIRLLARRELLGRLAADVGAEVVHDGLLAGQAEQRELERLRHEREAEVEVEDVGARQELGERAPLAELAADDAGREIE